MPAILNLVGRKFARLLVLARDGDRWRCLCDCGKTTLVMTYALNSGNTRSCGCLALDVRTKHGAARKGRKIGPEYYAWVDMKARCSNPNHGSYHRYGGRGITVCHRWIDSFSNFLADMGPRPNGLTLERKDNDSGYSPDNCKWASRDEQASNRLQHYRFLTFRGKTRSVKDWSSAFGVPSSVIKSRLYDGWPVKESIITPVIDLSRMLSFGGETKTLQQWADFAGLTKGALKGRLKSGWDLGTALTTPKLSTWSRHEKRGKPRPVVA